MSTVSGNVRRSRRRCRGGYHPPAQNQPIRLPNPGAIAALPVPCRGDLWSPALPDQNCCQFALVRRHNLIVLRGRPQVAPTAGLHADDIRLRLEIQSVRSARADDIRPYSGLYALRMRRRLAFFQSVPLRRLTFYRPCDSFSITAEVKP